MNKFLLGACLLVFSFSTMAATNNVEQAKSKISRVVTNGFTLINYSSSAMMEISPETVNLATLECEENGSTHISCTVDFKNRNAQNQQPVLLFEINEESGLITQVSQFIVKEE